MNAKDTLVEFLDRRAFRPVLQADPANYPESKRERVRHVQRATEDERERYHHYDSARKVYEMYRDDLTSDAAKEVHRELQTLGLPTLDDVRDEFERLATQVGANR